MPMYDPLETRAAKGESTDDSFKACVHRLSPYAVSGTSASVMGFHGKVLVEITESHPGSFSSPTPASTPTPAPPLHLLPPSQSSDSSMDILDSDTEPESASAPATASSTAFGAPLAGEPNGGTLDGPHFGNFKRLGLGSWLSGHFWCFVSGCARGDENLETTSGFSVCFSVLLFGDLPVCWTASPRKRCLAYFSLPSSARGHCHGQLCKGRRCTFPQHSRGSLYLTPQQHVATLITSLSRPAPFLRRKFHLLGDFNAHST